VCVTCRYVWYYCYKKERQSEREKRRRRRRRKKNGLNTTLSEIAQPDILYKKPKLQTSNCPYFTLFR
jgi:hypothetical protein